jgi:hypothetical protein
VSRTGRPPSHRVRMGRGSLAPVSMLLMPGMFVCLPHCRPRGHGQGYGGAASGRPPPEVCTARGDTARVECEPRWAPLILWQSLRLFLFLPALFLGMY